MNVKSYLINIAKPFTRFLARALDYSIFYCFFILPLFFTALLDHDTLHLACVLLVPFFWIPFEALFISLLGTTPGKALLGIHIRDSNCKKLSLKPSFKRSFITWIKGVGCNLPILNIYLAVKRFRQMKAQGVAPWDSQDVTQFYHKKKKRLRTIISSLLMVIFSLFFIAEYEVREVITSSSQAFTGSGCFKKENWKTYADPKGDYILEFPGVPEISETKIAIPKSKDHLPFQTINYFTESMDVEYNLTHTILPDSWLKWNSALLLRGALKVVASHISDNAKILKKHTKRYKNYPAVEFVMQKKNNQECAGRLILVGNVLYKIEVIYPKEKQTDVQDQLNAFLDSFEPK